MGVGQILCVVYDGVFLCCPFPMRSWTLLSQFLRVFISTLDTRNRVLKAEFLTKGCRYNKIRKAFSNFYRRHFDIVSKYNVGLKTLQDLSEPKFYVDFVFEFQKKKKKKKAGKMIG